MSILYSLYTVYWKLECSNVEKTVNCWCINFNFHSEHSKNFKPEETEVQIPGKNCIVTGANSGIGYAAAEGLAQRFWSLSDVCFWN